MEKEMWAAVIGYEGFYEVSTLGNIRNAKTQRQLKPKTNRYGYLIVNLSKKSKVKTASIHRLVAEAFIPNPNHYTCVNHKDENKLNCNSDNLEWCDIAYNNRYGKRIQHSIQSNTNGIRSKRVFQYDLNGNLIKEYPSTHQVARDTGYSQGNIQSCLVNKRKSAYGYVWRYAD